ncbi:transcription initiation factor TFIID subunit D5 [Galdieria sulphuraria]|uniref:Transcription initiation factor TFIID subunit D5 n=1 Tax=Galdieria sulphuraria TaxID=130081 RepID=M2XF36_GALSU|nr:transcription initiation factor TFIID subunit D5 [Galdieria sulphuraria]EME28617.1 transcription initiation factor TFIID subunit D5 [Galdieria sulphuraria]|eukprot:XP_005705137.1 transcription initiation factor TFIID subunit D5 [Galdieria sulphuraria]
MMEATLRKETCQAVAQYILGVESVSEDVSIAIIEDTEYRLRQLLQESVKFMRNSKRTKLLPKDINSALRLENMEPIFGYSAPRRKQFRVVKSCPGLYVLDDDLVDLKRALDEPLPKAPFEPALEAHWLAVEGVQPAIWQNPLRDQLKDAKTTSESVPVEALKPLKHALSKEFQLLYDHVISILRDEDGEKKKACLRELARQPGIQQLVPYFTLYIHEEVRLYHNFTERLFSVMQLTRALITNPNIHIEPYLHQVMPSVLTCILGKKLCSSWMDPHWHLRDYSSSVLGFIYKHFGPNYATLQTRVTKTLISALLDEKRPLSTRYGAIVGLVSLGVCEVQICLMPHLPYLSQQTEAELHRSDLEDERKLSLAKIYGALILAAHVCLKQNEMKGIDSEVSRNEDSDDYQETNIYTIHIETCRSFDTEEKNRILSFVPKFDSLVEVLYEQFGDSMFPTVSNYF